MPSAYFFILLHYFCFIFIPLIISSIPIHLLYSLYYPLIASNFYLHLFLSIFRTKPLVSIYLNSIFIFLFRILTFLYHFSNYLSDGQVRFLFCFLLLTITFIIINWCFIDSIQNLLIVLLNSLEIEGMMIYGMASRRVILFWDS